MLTMHLPELVQAEPEAAQITQGYAFQDYVYPGRRAWSSFDPRSLIIVRG